MDAKEKIQKMVEDGIIKQSQANIAAQMLANAIKTKDLKTLENELDNQLRPIGSVEKVFPLIFARVPNANPMDKPKESQPQTHDIAAEMEKEKQDYLEWRELENEIAEIEGTEPRKLSQPDDPRWDRHPSIFDGPYHGHEEYRHNTWASVYAEAKEANTSMHEICRRKNLKYEFLLY